MGSRVSSRNLQKTSVKNFPERFRLNGSDSRLDLGVQCTRMRLMFQRIVYRALSLWARIQEDQNLVLARVSDALADHLPCFLKLKLFV